MTAEPPILWHGRPIEELSHAELLDAFRRTYAALQIALDVAEAGAHGWHSEAEIHAEYDV